MAQCLCHGCPNVSGLVALVLLTAATTHYATRVFQSLTEIWKSADCQRECIEPYLSGAADGDDQTLIETIQQKFLVPPPEFPNTSPVDIDDFIWKDFVNWDKVQGYLLELWKDRPPGTFVEVGAVDGEFMSQTLLLERNLSWTGLLVEPDPRSFKLLRENGRNAIITNFAVLPEKSRAEAFWLHEVHSDLPMQYASLVMARSRLAFEVVTQEIKHGRTVYVKCAPLSSLLLAANMTQVDLLTIATGTKDDRALIADVLKSRQGTEAKTVLLQYQRQFLMDNPYPPVPGYIADLGRSTLLVRLYWKKKLCKLVDNTQCERQQYFDLMKACFKYLCGGFATVWSFK